MSRPLRICFIAPAAYPILAADRSIRLVGGAEVQQALISSQLARRGHDVSMISMDFGQREGDVVNGVRLLKMHAPDAGLPVVRFLSPRLTSLWGAMRRADANIYYQRACGSSTAFVARFALSYGKRSVFASAADSDFDPALPQLRYARDRALFRYGLRRVHRVVVQSERQAQLCLRNYGRPSIRIDNGYGHTGQPAKHDGPILWVGAIRSYKRPELFVDLAERLPQFRFRMVGGSASGGGSFEALRLRAQALGNLEMTGFVPHAEVEAYFDSASLLINTSVGEGFPNTFLQAWSRGIPTVSFFDAEARHIGADVGTVVTDFDAMADAVASFKADHARWLVHGRRAADYCHQNHSVTRAVDAYERVFEEVARLPAGITPSVA